MSVKSILSRNTSLRRSLPLTKKEKTSTHLKCKSKKYVSNSNASLCSNSSDETNFYDARSDVCMTVETKTERVGSVCTAAEKSFSNRNTTKVKTRCRPDRKLVDAVSLTERIINDVEEHHYKTINNIKNETKQKLHAFVTDIERSYVNSVKELRRESLNILRNLKTDVAYTLRGNDDDNRTLELENRHLKNAVKKLSTEVERCKQETQKLENYYEVILNGAQKEINNQKLTIDILKEELDALTMKARLQCILRTKPSGQN